jgi:hypothetical protein
MYAQKKQTDGNQPAGLCRNINYYFEVVGLATTLIGWAISIDSEN